MSRPALAAATLLVMAAFAANSVLARLALAGGHADALAFTAVRLAAGAAVLGALVVARRVRPAGDTASALALLVYAAAFSVAYLALPTGTGALVLFGSVQVTMIGWGVAHGEHLRTSQMLGLILALGGLAVVVAPGVGAPPLGAAALMAVAGAAWGAYSLRGRSEPDATAATAGNFLRAAPIAAVLMLAAGEPHADPTGIGLAVASGALTSGLGYAAWYAVLPRLRATTASAVQLGVPVLAALGGVAFASEALSLRLAAASAATLGGIALVARSRRPAREPN
ncbi:MAG TPA: EamA family transporter [Rubricoccaceae bacterium]